MELERNTFEALIDYLKKHGYPESSLAIEYPAGRKHRIDLAIIDPETNLPIQIFEVKSKDNRSALKFGKRQLQTYLSSLNLTDIPAYLVFPKEEYPSFRIKRVSLDQEEPSVSVQEENDNYNFLNFSRQKLSRISKKIEETKESKEETSTHFNWVCWLLSALLLILFLLVKFTSFSLNAVEFSILGGSVALVIIPFASKLKFLGVEFERLKKEKKN